MAAVSSVVPSPTAPKSLTLAKSSTLSFKDLVIGVFAVEPVWASNPICESLYVYESAKAITLLLLVRISKFSVVGAPLPPLPM